MAALTRRNFVAGAAAAAGAFALAGCNADRRLSGGPETALVQGTPIATPGLSPKYAGMYAAIPNERFPIYQVDLARIEPQFLRYEVDNPTDEPPGTIVVDPDARFLYHVQPEGRATRYGVGVGREGFAWSGEATVNHKREWPDWYPPEEMLERQPELLELVTELQSGIGMAGGPRNPIGARALYLWQNGEDTLYRIHGTPQPYTIGRFTSSGCIRMINQDAIHLYERTSIGARVVVLPSTRLTVPQIV